MKDDDILLSAYLDGELGTDECAALELRLSEEPALAAKLEELKANDEAMRRVFDDINNTPMPKRLLALLQPPAAPRRSAFRPLLLAAASCAALALAWTLRPADDAATLQNALSHYASGEGNDRIQVEFSFLTHDRRLCRQYLLSRAEDTTRAIACFEVDQWLTVANMPVEQEADDTLYRPAGAAQNDLDTFIEQHIQGSPLTRHQEAQSLDRIQAKPLSP